MLEIPSLPGNPDVSTENGEDGLFGEDERIGIGNRWPRQETLVLLKIRSEMDSAFRDANLKGPLWEEVSRKLLELGFNRSAKKCKEKFENIYKYHKRTKEGRSARQNGKTYRFFEQLEALDTVPMHPHPPSTEKIQTPGSEIPRICNTTVVHNAIPCSMINPNSNFIDSSSSTPTTSSSSKESERRQKKKRKFGEYFEKLMKEVIEKQENLQRKFLEVLDKCEQERIAREEAWKVQELARIKRERELLVQERSIAAAKDAAVLAFLQKYADQLGPVQFPENITPGENVSEKQNDSNGVKVVDSQENSNGGISIHVSSSRWPKEEVEALIQIRSNLDMQCVDNGPKGSLWEEISLAMKKLGYIRNAKRCKEKWENINKYFKRVKESNKRRPDDSKTCPYFHQLDALYKEKTKKLDSSRNSRYELKPEELLMHMVDGEAPPLQIESAVDDGEGKKVNQDQRDHENNDDEDDDDEDDDYQLVAHDNLMEVMS